MTAMAKKRSNRKLIIVGKKCINSCLFHKKNESKQELIFNIDNYLEYLDLPEFNEQFNYVDEPDLIRQIRGILG